MYRCGMKSMLNNYMNADANDDCDDDMMMCCIFAFMAYYDEGTSVHLMMMGLRSVIVGGFNPIVWIGVLLILLCSLVEG